MPDLQTEGCGSLFVASATHSNRKASRPGGMTTNSHDCSGSDTVATSGGESERSPNPQALPSPYVFSDYAQWERRPTLQRRPVAHSCVAHSCVPHSLKQLVTTETRRPRTDAKLRTNYGRRQAKPPEQVSVKLLRVKLILV